MLILTDRELEFLASVHTNWRRLYWNELARLLKEAGQPRRRPARSLLHRTAIQQEKRGQILMLAPESREYDMS
jgi:hypothetical protein